MYEIRHAGVKGYGVFAKTRIPRGTRILSEKPSLVVRAERDVFAAGRRLSSGNRAHLTQLSVNPAKQASVLSWMEVGWHAVTGVDAERSSRGGDVRPFWQSITEYPTLLNVFRNNNFDLGNGLQATFRDICRLNHSCVPCAQGNFNQAIGKFTIHSTRTIDAGEEITLSYLDEHGALRDSRREKLRGSYGFICDCPVCDSVSTRGQSSEKRRLGLHDKLRVFAEEASEKEVPELEAELGLMKELIALYEAEGLAGRELSTTYLSAAELAIKLDKVEDAGDLSRKGLQIEEDCLGSDNPLYHESVARVKRLQSQNP